jgi:hypothetical protein
MYAVSVRLCTMFVHAINTLCVYDVCARWHAVNLCALCVHTVCARCVFMLFVHAMCSCCLYTLCACCLYRINILFVQAAHTQFARCVPTLFVYAVCAVVHAPAQCARCLCTLRVDVSLHSADLSHRFWTGEIGDEMKLKQCK